MCEGDCQAQLEIAHKWLSDEHQECAKWLVDDYMSRFCGARFDKLASGTPAISSSYARRGQPHRRGEDCARTVDIRSCPRELRDDW
jgi:hypothetical protein